MSMSGNISGVGVEAQSETFFYPEDIGRGGIYRELTVKDTFGPGVHTPDMVVQIPELFDGLGLPNIENCVRCNYHSVSHENFYVPHGENHVVASGTVRLHQVKIVIPNGSYIPIIETQLLNRTMVPNINIMLLNEKGIREQYNYGQCHFTLFQAGRIMTLIVVRVQEYIHQYCAVNADTDDPEGNTAVEYNFGNATGANDQSEVGEVDEPEEAMVE